MVIERETTRGRADVQAAREAGCCCAATLSTRLTKLHLVLGEEVVFLRAEGDLGEVVPDSVLAVTSNPESSVARRGDVPHLRDEAVAQRSRCQHTTNPKRTRKCQQRCTSRCVRAFTHTYIYITCHGTQLNLTGPLLRRSNHSCRTLASATRYQHDGGWDTTLVHALYDAHSLSLCVCVSFSHSRAREFDISFSRSVFLARVIGLPARRITSGGQKKCKNCSDIQVRKRLLLGATKGCKMQNTAGHEKTWCLR